MYIILAITHWHPLVKGDYTDGKRVNSPTYPWGVPLPVNICDSSDRISGEALDLISLAGTTTSLASMMKWLLYEG